jgi:IclR family acetate operon transcriptional repressor
MMSAAARTMAVLDLLGSRPPGMTASEIVADLGIEKSVVSRILATLEKDGYVTRDGVTDLFRLGLRFVAIAFRYIESLGFYDVCMPEVRRLADETGELVQLAVVDREGMTYVAKAEGNQRIRVYSQLGREAVLHASTVGKIWLASLPEEAALALALRVGLTPFAKNTIRTIDALRDELIRVRAQGFALLEEELFDGGSAIGVPIKDRRDGTVLGAVVLAGPTFRLPRARLVEFAPTLVESAGRLAAAWPPDLSAACSAATAAIAGPSRRR